MICTTRIFQISPVSSVRYDPLRDGYAFTGWYTAAWERLGGARHAVGLWGRGHFRHRKRFHPLPLGPGHKGPGGGDAHTVRETTPITPGPAPVHPWFRPGGTSGANRLNQYICSQGNGRRSFQPSQSNIRAAKFYLHSQKAAEIPQFQRLFYYSFLPPIFVLLFWPRFFPSRAQAPGRSSLLFLENTFRIFSPRQGAIAPDVKTWDAYMLVHDRKIFSILKVICLCLHKLIIFSQSSKMIDRHISFPATSTSNERLERRR